MDEYVTTGAAWFTLSLVNAGLAQAKNRSGLNWWLVSLLLGPLATLLIVAWPRGDVAAAGEGEAAGRMTTTQAVVIGAVILLVVAGVSAVVALFGAGSRP
jgi:hypothetical protein